MGYGAGWGWLFGALLVAGLVLLIVVVMRLAGGGARARGVVGRVAPPGSEEARARQLLDERYARGEISTEEYQERRRVLDQDL